MPRRLPPCLSPGHRRRVLRPGRSRSRSPLVAGIGRLAVDSERRRRRGAEVDAEGEPRVRDIDLAERAGMAQPQTSARSSGRTEELEQHGQIAMRAPRAHRQGRCCWCEERDVEETAQRVPGLRLRMLLREGARAPRGRRPRLMAARSLDPRVPGAQLMARMFRLPGGQVEPQVVAEEIVVFAARFRRHHEDGEGSARYPVGVIG